MRLSSRLIERYIVRAILPYLFLSLLLLTAILFTQQSGKFAELLVTAHVPLPFITEIVFALLPNVLVFTLPMSVLAGTLIGFSRMGSDSELVAMRTAGTGTWNMLWPVLLIGLTLSAATLYLNLEVAPQSAHALRQAGLRAALYKLNSPVEPRSFNTEIPGYVVYVRDGDKEQGQWGRVFIYSLDKDGATKLWTARSGRIDAAAEQSELVLSDVVAIKLPAAGKEQGGSYVMERLAQLRLQMDTGRKSLLARLRSDRAELDEMEWGALINAARSRSGSEAGEALRLLHKRLTLGLSPVVFALLGAALGLRVRKGGRGMGLLLSLLTMVAYYLLSLMGEQMVRAGKLPPFVGLWLATFLTVGFSLFLLFAQRSKLPRAIESLRLGRRKREGGEGDTAGSSPQQRSGARTRWLSFPILLDLSILRSLCLAFLLALTSLTAIFLIFTLFELWRFILSNGVGASVVARYLIYLLPYVAVQLFPASILLAVLGVYALIARRSEAIAWWSSGQSVYRLVAPGLFFACLMGAGAWLVQERVMPSANVKQDALRTQIRGNVTRVTTSVGRQWLASARPGRLYSYEYDDNGGFKDLSIYDFDADGVHLARIIAGSDGGWSQKGVMEVREAEVVGFAGGRVSSTKVTGLAVEVSEPPEVFKPTIDKPSQLSAKELSAYINALKARGGEISALAVALQKKYAEPFSAVVMALIGIPLALRFGRRSAIAALCSAVAIGLLFWMIGGGFQQLGGYGMLPAIVAAWSPLTIFAAVGAYLLSRSRT